MHTANKASLRQIHRYSWVSLLVCWLIWILNAYDREIVLHLGATITKHFNFSLDDWDTIATLIMLALALLDILGAMWSDRYGAGWKRARFQVPLVLGYTALSFLSGFKVLSHSLTSFVALRIGVNLGAGWGESVGVSNTAEWWPVERRGFALGAYHTGYPIGALLSGLVANAVWPIYYAVASDAALPSATSTANGIITTAMFIGGGIAPVLMSWQISVGNGWTSLGGYVSCFFLMAACALGGALLQPGTRTPANPTVLAQPI
ncbi:MFS transporter [Pseudomonas oryzihabitans]|uniref:MFS transporter n=1 Tax=Pseudomonas oryzihabitans TaxID=47885 RepID=UPI002893F799|nr:MFS transporter [Pseudomonas oryzihabitans]MDT3723079.1 MFS transporter [Pseudomonas oryzihabitans]